jgi:non-homologous end joining protein Ku
MSRNLQPGVLLRKKQGGFRPPTGKEAAATSRNVINLMDALKASIRAERKPAAGAKRSASTRKRA